MDKSKMAKIRNLFILLIIIGLIVVGGTKALLWYYTDKTAKDIQDTLPPGVFNYSGVSTSLQGSSSIDNITISYAGQSIKIEKIELKSKNIVELLGLIFKNWGSKIPNQIALRIQGITVHSTALLNNKQIADSFRYPFDIPCGKVKKIGLVEYMDIGYQTFVFDIDLAYQKISARRIKASFDLNTRNASKFSSSFYGDASLLNPMVASDQKKNAIPEFEMHWSEDVFTKKLYNYCAQKENKSLDQYIADLPPFSKKEIDQASVDLFGFTLNDEIVNAINEYIKNPKEFYIATKPKGPVTLEELKAMNEQVALELVHPSLRINGKNIPVEFKWTTSEQLAQNDPVNSVSKKPIIKSAERQLTPINQLNAKAFNKNIEVHMSSGVIYKGAFRKVEGGSLHMTIHKRLGSSDLALKTDVIRLVYILSDY
ncbi:hypothetical protein [Entomomonas asaccharolytica]|uniref:Uncharacterized protein n=1 Tax=Entomomonas asaccharolytica TaxID=2785331 RepID=A0A974NG51_9GAMM|nr:hypothetical protein [Entomomonas asaccharolytica]QQP85887.1 hypothetical protein JHT90_01090 [Entomomonas asaccharolytica]